jgi:bacteriorhodopsin
MDFKEQTFKVSTDNANDFLNSLDKVYTDHFGTLDDNIKQMEEEKKRWLYYNIGAVVTFTVVVVVTFRFS